jgi:hypothetical protein
MQAWVRKQNIKMALFGLGFVIFVGLLLLQNRPLNSFKLLVALGLWALLFYHQKLVVYRRASTILLNTLLLLFAIELFSLMALTIWDRLPQDGPPAMQMAYYQEQAWGARYWQEEQAMSTQYKPYTVWRMRSFEGETISIDKQGLRPVPGSNCELPGAYEVYSFGGSAFWGVGSPNGETIAAQLLPALKTQIGREICWRNFAQHAYIMNQNLIELSLQLQAGGRPDLVIFYDGFNELISMAQHQQAGVHHNYYAIEHQLETGGLSNLRLLIQSSSLVEAITRLVLALSQTEGWSSHKIPADEVLLSQEAVALYFAGYELVAALAEHYGFDYRLFWQPSFYTSQKPLSPYENGLLDDFSPSVIRLIESGYAAFQTRLASDSPPYLYSLVAVCDARPGELWIESVHVTPEGNAIIAQAMLPLLPTAPSD